MASKFVLSDTASWETVGATSRRLCVLDVKRAFLYGLIEEEIHVELPDAGVRGKLVKAMYGTRSAPLQWQKVAREKMKALGFHACVTVPCMYYLQGRDVFVVVHVDDFLCSGKPRDLAWFRGEFGEFVRAEVTGCWLWIFRHFSGPSDQLGRGRYQH